MNAPVKLAAKPDFIFSHVELNALEQWFEQRRATNPRFYWGLLELTAAAVDALNGEEDFGPEDHIKLQAEMEACECDSVWRPLQKLEAEKRTFIPMEAA